jgi:NitT/TauT family transport system substrate-binding protein
MSDQLRFGSIFTLGIRLLLSRNRRRDRGPTAGGENIAMPFARFARIAAALIGTLAGGFASAQQPAPAFDKVTFGTNWVAEAELGGFYQAIADRTYAKYGLDVTIVPGGPNVNNRMMLGLGKLDFFISANTLQALDAVANDVPTVIIAAMFQKDPQVLLAHPGTGLQSFEDLKRLTLYASKEGLAGYFQWLKAEFGFREDRVKPYMSDLQAFITDKQSALQGYVTSEPYVIEKTARIKPIVFLLADQGFSGYSTLIETRRNLIDDKPGLVQRFVDASIIGWYNYLYGDPKLGNELIKKNNPEMNDELIAYSAAKMREHGIVDSGDALTFGIGALTDARMIGFFDKMVRAGVVKPTVDFRRAYTLQFVNKKVGIELRPAK